MTYLAPAPLDSDLSRYHLAREQDCLDDMMPLLEQTREQISAIEAHSLELINAVRAADACKLSLESFLHEYPLGSQECHTLLSLTEALLRIPDRETAQTLINDKLKQGHWQASETHDSIFMNASNWALRMGGSLIGKGASAGGKMAELLGQLSGSYTEPMVQAALKHAMRRVSSQFVFAPCVDQACKLATPDSRQSYSFDLLSEPALSRPDAERYLRTCYKAVEKMSAWTEQQDASALKPSFNLRLSSAHAKYQYQAREQLFDELIPDLLPLLVKARQSNIDVILDSEHSELLELQLEIYSRLLQQAELSHWQGLGFTVQAYSKRALATLRYLHHLAQQLNLKLPIRLIKGNDWDHEILRAQQSGLSDYPVFSRKSASDVSYLACAQFLLQQAQHFRPTFASHNAQTLASIMTALPINSEVEFQRLHGTGESLYEQILAQRPKARLRISAPIGKHKYLLPYLVRQVMENNSNTAFIQHLVNSDINSEQLASHPLRELSQTEPLAPPAKIHQNWCAASHWHPAERQAYSDFLEAYRQLQTDSKVHCGPIINGKKLDSEQGFASYAADSRQQIAYCYQTDAEQIHQAIDHANLAFKTWQQTQIEIRAEKLQCFAELLQSRQDTVIQRLIQETGQTLDEAIRATQQAINSALYYAEQAINLFAQGTTLPSRFGEENTLHWHGRGVFLCISPWHSPVAVFSEQICAALAAGNCVIAKPSPRACLSASLIIELLLEAGIPSQVLHLCPGDAENGRFLCQQDGIHGVSFHGSLANAKEIQQLLYQYHNNLLPFIAKTNGQNVLLADSSMPVKELVSTVIQQAFYHAGQAGQSLRLVYIQEDIADAFYQTLTEAMAQLQLGPGQYIGSDIGPIAKPEALQKMQAYLEQQSQIQRVLYQAPMPLGLQHPEHYMAPAVLRCHDIKDLTQDISGPFLHLCHFHSSQTDKVIEHINTAGFVLSLSIYSRNDAWALRLAESLLIGNVYINQSSLNNTIGFQPSTGLNLSGSGNQFGGPYTLQAYAYAACTSH